MSKEGESGLTLDLLKKAIDGVRDFEVEPIFLPKTLYISGYIRREYCWCDGIRIGYITIYNKLYMMMDISWR